MGIFSEGTPLKWSEILPHINSIKRQGIAQFISIYNAQKDVSFGQRRWGDEIEYTIVKFDHNHKKIRVSLRASEILKQLKSRDINGENVHLRGDWMPECGAFMVEGIPVEPYDGTLSNFKNVELNMRSRRAEVRRYLEEGEALLSACFPSLGTPDFTDPQTFVHEDHGFPKVNDTSQLFPDDAIQSCHFRYRNLIRNILERRGESRQFMNAPIFYDTHTPKPFLVVIKTRKGFTYKRDIAFGSDTEAMNQAKTGQILMDHMGFGMGLCCLQVTFEAATFNEARLLYDQLSPLAPIFLALSAATPIYKSFLSNVDARWDVVSQSCDDRSPGERGLLPLKNNEFIQERRRYDIANCYIHPDSILYNDVPIKYNQEHFKQLLDGDVDEPMAQYIAHMFTRDPLEVTKEDLEHEDKTGRKFFDSLLSLNWQSIRLKPPPHDQDGGWRIEFRPTEVQLTDFENAAYSCFLALLTRLIISKRVDFLIPQSLTAKNMKRAQKRNAVLKEKFYFRPCMSHHYTNDIHNDTSSPNSDGNTFKNGVNLKMTINHIINGDRNGHPGLVPLCRQFLDENGNKLDQYSKDQLNLYLTLIQNRASGRCLTLARWIRDFVQSHPQYKHDSFVDDRVVYDMFVTMDAISNRDEHCEKLLGDVYRNKHKFKMFLDDRLSVVSIR